MADFHQVGSVATLHNLTDRPLDELESELVGFSKKRPMGLLLPCLFSELETEAMPRILAEVKQVPYLDQRQNVPHPSDSQKYYEGFPTRSKYHPHNQNLPG